MGLHIVCDKCQKKLAVKLEFAGKKIKCPSCQAIQKVPDDLAEEPAAPARPAPVKSAPAAAKAAPPPPAKPKAPPPPPEDSGWDDDEEEVQAKPAAKKPAVPAPKADDDDDLDKLMDEEFDEPTPAPVASKAKGKAAPPPPVDDDDEPMDEDEDDAPPPKKGKPAGKKRGGGGLDCPHCLAELSAGDTSCDACGADLDRPATKEAIKSLKAKLAGGKKSLMMIGLLIFVLVLVAIASNFIFDLMSGDFTGLLIALGCGGLIVVLSWVFTFMWIRLKGQSFLWFFFPIVLLFVPNKNKEKLGRLEAHLDTMPKGEDEDDDEEEAPPPAKKPAKGKAKAVEEDEDEEMDDEDEDDAPPPPPKKPAKPAPKAAAKKPAKPPVDEDEEEDD